MLSLSEMQKSWPVCSWVLKLFEQLLSHKHGPEAMSNSGSTITGAGESDPPVQEKNDGRGCDPMLGGTNAEQTGSGLYQNDVDAGAYDLREVGRRQDEEDSSNIDLMQSFANNRSFALDNTFSTGDYGFDLNENTEFLSYLLAQAPPT